MHISRTRLLTFSVVLLSIAFWSYLLIVYGADRLVDMIGVQNGYLVMFLVSLFGGISSLGAVSYIATIITLASGGLNPVFLALASGAGVSVGDTVYFWLGWHGRVFLKETKIHTYVRKVTDWLNQQRKPVIWTAIYGVIAIGPVPNDIITIALGLARQNYYLVISALVLGNITHTYLIATASITIAGL